MTQPRRRYFNRRRVTVVSSNANRRITQTNIFPDARARIQPINNNNVLEDVHEPIEAHPDAPEMEGNADIVFDLDFQV